MGTPELDEDGFPIPYDDGDIKNDHRLIRYICPIKDVQDNRIISSAYSTSGKKVAGENPGMSVNFEASMIAAGETVESRAPSVDQGIAALVAGDIRGLSENIKIGQTPTKDNPHHTDVWGVKNKKKKLKDLVEILRNPATVDD